MGDNIAYRSVLLGIAFKQEKACFCHMYKEKVEFIPGTHRNQYLTVEL